MEFAATILIADPPLSHEQFEALLPLVSKEKQERAGKFRFFKDAQNCLLGDILARFEICRAAGLTNRQLSFGVNKYGKPYLQNHPEIHFNISHSNHYVALAAGNEPVGIDIECMKSFNENIAKRFFAPDEIRYITDATGDLRCRRFFETWTKKEARVKWEGKGLSKPLPSFSVLGYAEEEQVYYHEVFSDGEAISHVCSAMKQPPEVKILGIAELISSAESYK